MLKKRRVAITGLGVVSPLGNNVAATWRALMAGDSGIDYISQFDASAFPTKIAAEVKNFNMNPALKTKKNRFAAKFTQFALEAAKQAVDDANFSTLNPNPRFGVVCGSGMMTADFSYLLKFQKTCAQDGAVNWPQLAKQSDDFFDLYDFGSTTSNTGLSLLINQFNCQGYANSVHTACASSGQALGLAMQVLRRGDADIMLAGGFDSMINPIGLSSFCLLGALSTYNDTPKSASRPFDKSRNGFVLGEGAAFLILEEWEHATQRGAYIYAELAGEGNSLSSYRITDSHPNGDGAIQAIRGALQDANLDITDVDYINAHGTSTQMNDLSESNAIKQVFNNKIQQICVSSTKGQTGHLIAAAGALEALISTLAIKNSYIPINANLNTPDPECDLNFITKVPIEKSIGVALSNSFGFGGSNSCLVFKHPEFGA